MTRATIPPEMLSGEYLYQRFGATLADYERAADEDTRLELYDGVMIMHSPASVQHENLFGFLFSLLRGYVAPRRLGRVLGSRTPMVLDDERRFEPDLLFITNANLARLGEIELRGPADLMIEILSPATRDYDLGRKRDAYAEGTVPESWIIDPAASRLLTDRPAGTHLHELSADRLTTPSIVGFWLDVTWLWQRPLPDVAECLRQIGA